MEGDLMKEWTAADEEMLIAKWGHSDLKTLAQMLDTTVKSVRAKAKHLRRQGEYLPHKRKAWDECENLELKRLRADKIPDEEISKTLNRSPRAILQHAAILRKRGYDIPDNRIRNKEYPRAGMRWTKEDTATFLATINAKGIESTADRLQRTPLAIAHRVRLLGQKYEFHPAVIGHADDLLEVFEDFKDRERKGDDAE
jgi:biotin operon repressor